MGVVQSQNIIKASATSSLTPPPQAREHQVEVAKLIHVTTCIGCKACQVDVQSGMISVPSLKPVSVFTITRPI